MSVAVLQVNERIRTYIPGRGLGRGRGPPGGGPGDPLRGAPLPGRGGPGRGPGHYSGPQDFRGGAPGPRSRDLPSSFANRISDHPPRDNGYAGRPGRDQPQASVRDRLGPRLSSAISQDFQRAQPEAPAEIPDNAEVGVAYPALLLLARDHANIVSNLAGAICSPQVPEKDCFQLL